VAGSGTVDLSDLGTKGPVLDLRLAAHNARLLNRVEMAAAVTGPLRIVSDGLSGTIAGRVSIDTANWQLGRASAATQLPNIPTREINAPADIARYAAEVTAAIGAAPTTPHQFDALVSFHYNTGAIAKATLTRRHIAGDFAAACAEFGKWIHNDGKVLRGLVRRRAEEAELYGRFT
jgi:hypothetical protein